MDKRHLAVLLLLMTSADAGRGESVLVLTLPQALELAEKQNVDVALASLELQKFESQYKQALGNAFPSLSFTGLYTRHFKRPVIFFGGQEVRIGEDNSLDLSLGAEQALYSGGKVMKGIEAAQMYLRAETETVRGTREEVLLAVKRLFYGAVFAREVVAIQEENLANAQRHDDTIRERFNQGLDSDLAVRRQSVETANARASLISARNWQDTVLLNIQELLALDMDRPLQIEGGFEPLPGNLSESGPLKTAALERRPELQAARNSAAAYKALISVYSADHKPQLGAFANVNWSAQTGNWTVGSNESAESLNGGLILRHSLFNGGKTRARVRQARIDYERARLARERLERSVKKEVQETWLAVKEAEERARAQGTAVEQSRRVLEATEVRYRAGEAGQLELNDVTFALNRARLAEAQAVHDYWVNRAALERAAGTGTPLEETKP
ncbi:MAG: TolC family protein [Elusimicrobia bacterium]|nr:TolC family protein [Elusimicrobiota bacterium]